MGNTSTCSYYQFNMTEWTVETLKEHTESLLEEKDKALAAALIAVKEENRKTEIAAEKRFELLNELRGGVATKEQLEALEKTVTDLRDRLNRNDGKGVGLSDGWKYLLGALGAGAIVYGFIN